MIPEGIDMDHYDPLPGWGLIARLSLVALFITLFAAACTLEHTTTARDQEMEGAPVLSGEASGDDTGMSAYAPYARYVEKARIFHSTGQYNDWRRDNPDLEIMDREVSSSAAAHSAHEGFSWAHKQAVQSTYTITVFYLEQVEPEH